MMGEERMAKRWGLFLVSTMAVSGLIASAALAETSGRLALADLASREAVKALIDNVSVVE